MACKKCIDFIVDGFIDGAKLDLLEENLVITTSQSGDLYYLGEAQCPICKSKIRFTWENFIHKKLHITVLDDQKLV